MEILILGAGIAGLGAAYEARKHNFAPVILEKSDRWGGLCDNFEVNGFRFDTAIHLSFTEIEFVKELFSSATPVFTHKPESSNYADGNWIRHPVQSNLYDLPVDERIKVIKSFISTQVGQEKSKSFDNYEQWLRAQFGLYFSQRYPERYTRKYWATDAKNLTTEWVGPRFFVPKIDEILFSAMSADTPNRYYAKEMRYPQAGGYKKFLSPLVVDANIRFNQQVIEIDPKRKTVRTTAGETYKYDKLISSLPLPIIARLIVGAPSEVLKAAEELKWTSVALVSLCFNKDIQLGKDPKLWFYIYDEDILPARGYYPSMKSPENAPAGMSSLQFELYHSRDKPIANFERIGEKVVSQCSKLGLFSKADISAVDVRNLPFGNVVFTHNYDINTRLIKTYLDSLNIESVGRFGEWKYFWSDQSLMSGINGARKILSL